VAQLTIEQSSWLELLELLTVSVTLVTVTDLVTASSEDSEEWVENNQELTFRMNSNENFGWTLTGNVERFEKRRELQTRDLLQRSGWDGAAV
jgi:hypothetical protein